MPIKSSGSRFIPAGAGNSITWLCRMTLSPVYPRWRGELSLPLNLQADASGLSPLARGTLKISSPVQDSLRFIPAGAGNSKMINTRLYDFPVYPRWRGELRPVETRLRCSYGLSPLARGTRSREALKFADQRFIPAGAGNSALRSTTRSTRSVYPRWRGELQSGSASYVPSAGLSPLARGTLHGVGTHQHLRRFIPAGAGNSLNTYTCF